MTESSPSPNHDTERIELHNRLAAIDRDPLKLQAMIGELYTAAPDNPHVFYTAATHLTALTHLEHRDQHERMLMPSQAASMQAFDTYTQLIAILAAEREAPLYEHNSRVDKRLMGAREELAFHATLAYASAQSGEFVALPTPAGIDFSGAEEASDLQIFFPGAQEADIEIQVTMKPKGKKYHPRIAVLNLASVLDSSAKAVELRGLLRQIGNRPHGGATQLTLTPREHEIVIDGAAAIMMAARHASVPA